MLENKSKLIAVLVLVLIIFGIGFYVIWGIVLNTGTAVFNFERPPFNVSINDKTQVCLTNACEITVPTGPRSYSILKDGYYEKTGSVNIIRGEKSAVDVNLEFIPEALEGAEYKGLKLPSGYSKFSDKLKSISLFTEFSADFTLKKLPKILDNIIFSESGKKALIFNELKVYLYSLEDFSSTFVLGAGNAVTARFSSDEAKIYTIAFDETSKKYALKRILLEAPEISENLIYFSRDITSYDLEISPDEKFAAVLDKTFSPEVVYILDLAASSRTNVFEGYLINLNKWSENNEYFVFEGKDKTENLPSLYSYDSFNKKTEKLPFKADINNFDFNDKAAFFVTSDSYSVTNYDVPYILQFQQTNLNTTSIQELLNSQNQTKNIILVKWGLPENEFYLIKDLTDILENLPEKVEISSNETAVRLLVDGKYYDIKIGE